MTTTHKSKPAAGALAAFLGAIGAHRLYLGSRWWWVYAAVSIPCAVWALQFREWFKQPAFFLGMLPIIIGLGEAIYFSLMRDERWDAKYNAQSGQTSQNRWPPVLIAIFSLMAGATLLMTTLVLLFQTYFEAQLGL
jgi:TM2 domain-containing membrane protein YozV